MAYLSDVPKFAFGTAYRIGNGENEIRENDFKNLIKLAIKLGCRHFDCAPLYGTQSLFGEAFKESMETHSRNDFFITSKLPVNMMQTENIERSLMNTLEQIQLTHLDLFLIHAPFSTKHINDNDFYPLDGEGNLLIDDSNNNLLESAWLKLVDLKRKGLTRHIGLSNVNLEQLIRLNKLHQVDVVQNEYHIYNQDREVFDYCEEIDVHYEAYAAFGCPQKALRDKKPCIWNDLLVNRVAKENSLTIAQVVIQWLHNQPLSYVIKSDNVNQLKENLQAMNSVTISLNDLIELDNLNQNMRIYLYDEYRGLTRHKEYPFKLRDIQKEPLGEQNKPLQPKSQLSYKGLITERKTWDLKAALIVNSKGILSNDNSNHSNDNNNNNTSNSSKGNSANSRGNSSNSKPLNRSRKQGAKVEKGKR